MKMKVSIERTGFIAFACVLVGFSLSGRAATATTQQACEVSGTYVLADAPRCAGPSDPWDLARPFERIVADYYALGAASDLDDPETSGPMLTPLAQQRYLAMSKFRADRDRAFDNKR